MPAGPSFSEVTDRLKVQIDAITALADAKVKRAEAEKIKAETAGQLERVRAMRALVSQLERDIRSFEKSRRKLKAVQQKLENRVKNAQFLLSGRRLSAARFATARANYRLLLQEALPTAGEDLIDTSIKASARTKDNFIPVKSNTEPTQAPESVDNVLELVGWMNRKRYTASVGSQAQLAVIKVFKAINAVAKAANDALREEIKGLRNGTLDPWNPSAIVLGSAPNAAASKVAKAGNKA